MTFKKIYLRQITIDTYYVSIEKKENHVIYFTDEPGFEFIKKQTGIVSYSQLPKPLLKQIK